MKRRYKATGVKAQRHHLTVFVTIEVGTTVRFATVTVPWSMIADHEQTVRNGLEREFERRAQAKYEAGQPWLPLETWE